MGSAETAMGHSGGRDRASGRRMQNLSHPQLPPSFFIWSYVSLKGVRNPYLKGVGK